MKQLQDQLDIANATYQAAFQDQDWDKAQAIAMVMMNLCRRLHLCQLQEVKTT